MAGSSRSSPQAMLDEHSAVPCPLGPVGWAEEFVAARTRCASMRRFHPAFRHYNAEESHLPTMVTLEEKQTDTEAACGSLYLEDCNQK